MVGPDLGTERMNHTIVLVHGLIGHLADPTILGAFGDHDVQAPDLIGYGSHQTERVDNLRLVDQAHHLLDHLAATGLDRVHLVGHSVGGAVAVLAAALRPETVVSLTSVEGNFVPSDAFWSAGLAKKSESEIDEFLAVLRADPRAWIAEAGVAPSPWSTALATSWLHNQPALTIKAQAAAVVEATEDPAYLTTIRQLIDSGLRFNLLAGERSSAGWGVPTWVRRAATTDRTISGVGHLMMAEAPTRFAEAVLAMTNGPRAGALG